MDEFDREIRSAFHRRQLPGAPTALVRSLDDLPRRQVRPTGAFRLVLGLAATLVILLVAVVVLGGGSSTPPVSSPQPSLPAVVNPSVAPSTEPIPSPTIASVPPSPSPTLAPPIGTPTPAISAGPAGMIDASQGWAVGDQRLLVTADGGSTWRDVTPPAPTEGGSAANLLGVQFLDPDHGWVAFAEPFKLDTDPGFGRVDVWRTTDGGQTWARSELPRAKINTAGDTLGPFSFDFIDPAHGFAFISGNYTRRLSDSDLYWTADGGATWSADHPTGPGSLGVEGSSISFASADDGVVAGSPVGSGIFVTHDGGKTWQAATLSAPAGFSGDLRVFSQPVFSDARTGLVAVHFQGDTQSATRIYRTIDGGSSWTFLAAVPGSGVLFVTIIDPRHWIATDGAVVEHTTDGGSSWSHGVSQPTYGGQQTGLQGVQFIDLDRGWAQWTDPQGNSHLIATIDGGSTWHDLEP